MARIAGIVCSAVLATTSVLAPAGPVQAHGCDRTDNDRAEASRVLRGITREIDAMERTIVEALRLQTGQLSGYVAQSAKALTQALDAQTRLQAQTAREVEETRTMRAHAPSRSACATVTGATGLGATRSASRCRPRRCGRGRDRPHRQRPGGGGRGRQRRRRRRPLRYRHPNLLQPGPCRRPGLPGR